MLRLELPDYGIDRDDEGHGLKWIVSGIGMAVVASSKPEANSLTWVPHRESQADVTVW